MWRSIKDLESYEVFTKDNFSKAVDDFYFDDEIWTIRYVVVNTGGWVPERQVLLSPVSLDPPVTNIKRIPTALTKKEIEEGPSIDADAPVSRRIEEELAGYYHWPLYWTTPNMLGGPAPMPAPKEAPSVEEAKKAGDPHLRSVREVRDYAINAADGELGHVADFIVDDDAWRIRYMIVDTRNWLPGKKVLVALDWITGIDAEDNTVTVDLTQEQIKGAPEFDPKDPVNRGYEEVLYDYYGRPKYWSVGDAV